MRKYLMEFTWENKFFLNWICKVSIFDEI
jgi:hypothetical protein